MSIRTLLSLVYASLVLSALLASSAVASSPTTWTTTQAKATIRAKAAEIYRDDKGQPQGLVKLGCHGTGKAVQHRFVAFRCAASFTGGASGTLIAKTRRGGGLCWSLTARVPSGCLGGGVRASGSMREAFLAWRSSLTVSPAYTACVANGSGFYSCWWSDTVTTHRGAVVFGPNPVVKMLS